MHDFSEVLGLLPFKLILTISGVGLLFALASANGTTQMLTMRLLSVTTRVRVAVPAMLFLATSLTSALGVGNIAATALIAPAALSLAPQLGLSPLLTSLVVIGGANAGALSPLSMTGILARELLPNLGLSAAQQTTFGWHLCGVVFGCVTLVHALGFLALGGARWIGAVRLRRADPLNRSSANDPPDTLSKDQRKTGFALLGFVLVVVVTSLPLVRQIAVQVGCGWAAEPGLIALGFAGLIVCCRLSSFSKAVRLLPWPTMGLITGMFVLSGLVERLGGLAVVAGWITDLDAGPGLASWLALFAGILSTFTSSSGVVMPLMLPMVSMLTPAGENPATFATAILLGAHLVDCSPLSSLGALCIAAAPNLTKAQRKALFRHLLLWGLAMAPVAAIITAII